MTRTFPRAQTRRHVERELSESSRAHFEKGMCFAFRVFNSSLNPCLRLALIP
jgi:hypothetical protein